MNHNMKITVLPVLLLLTAGEIHAQTGDVRPVHDPCIIRQGAYYYVFCTGRGIPIRRSNDLIHWQRVGTVFDEVPAWALAHVPAARFPWAPDISFDGGWYNLYYCVSRFAQNLSCIGLARNKTLDPASADYQWIDHGMVIASVPQQDNFNAIDAHFFAEESNDAWLAFGSYWSGIKLLRLDRKTGKPAETTANLLPLVEADVEAPFLTQHGRFYYLFFSHGRIHSRGYQIRLARSLKLGGPYCDRRGLPVKDNQGTLLLATHGDCVGPGHNAILREADRYWLVHHHYDPLNWRRPTLQIRPLLWGPDGWPLAAAPWMQGSEFPKQVESLEPAQVLGRWRHAVISRNIHGTEEITLRDDGAIHAAGWLAAWSIEGDTLVLNRPEKQGLAGSTSRCIVLANGAGYLGRDDNDDLVQGTRP
ncbi:MAG: hypothetical protein A2V70_13020 [Planctomycetes bacterium RBG_13_63_9]|nr:MAG: hypothetical protein A2V70_13020 [Planctomycetes bacterium RBG_13_63_9]